MKIHTLKIKLMLLLFLCAAEFCKIRAADFSSTYYDIVALGLIGIVILIFFAFLYFGMGEGKARPAHKGNALLARIRQMLTAATPVENEGEILLDHNYDGIKELDNRIPPWFSYLFYVTIIFAVYYMLDYHVLKTGILQEEEYALEMQQAEELRAELTKKGTFINEETVTLLTDENSLQSGKSIYISNCVACHREDGGGLIGPNLTDEFWIHGGSVQEVFKTIKYGVPAKGMISWQTQLNPRQMQQVMSFIMNMRGTNPPNPKAPEGNKISSPDTSKTVALN